MKNLISILSISVLGLLILCKKTPSNEIANELKETADSINKVTPQEINERVRLDFASVDDEKTIHYHYTLTLDDPKNMDAAYYENSKPLLKKEMIELIKTSPDLADLRKQMVTFKYSYQDRNKKPLLELVIAPKDYQ